MVKVRTVLLVVLLLLVGGFGLWAGYQWGHEPPPPPEIRTEIVERMVPVEVVKEIEVEVPGPERVVERIIVDTFEGEAAPEVIRDVRESPPDTPVMGRVRIQADKVEGAVDGTLTRGWIGEAACDVRVGDKPWRELVREPFNLTTSEALSVDPGGTIADRVARWRVEVRAGLTTAPAWSAGLSWYRRGRVGWWLQADRTLDYPTEWQVAGGVAFTVGRR